MELVIRLIWILLGAAIAFVADARIAHGDVYPDAGTWTIRGLTEPANPDSFDTASVRIFTDDGTLACFDVGPGAPFAVPVATSATLVPAEVRALAFPSVDCAGTPSDPSNAVTITLWPPGAVVLKDEPDVAAVPDPDVWSVTCDPEPCPHISGEIAIVEDPFPWSFQATPMDISAATDETTPTETNINCVDCVLELDPSDSIVDAR